MSFILMAKAIQADIKNCHAKWLMVVLADHANEETHQCWPSLDRLQARTHMDKSTVTRKLNWLEENGWITRERGNSKRSTLYTIFPTDAHSISAVADCTPNLSLTSQSNKRKKREQIPDEWVPNEDLRISIDTIMKENFDHDFEASQFKDYHQSKGNVFADIGKAYRGWLRNGVKWGTAKTVGGKTVGNSRPTSGRQKTSYFSRINSGLQDN